MLLSREEHIHGSLAESEGEKRGGSASEEGIRSIFERLFHRRFPTSRIHEAENMIPGGAGDHYYELDGYSPEYRLAFEFQGPMHYSYDPLYDAHGRRIAGEQWVAPEDVVLTPDQIHQLGDLRAKRAKWLHQRENDVTKLVLAHTQGIDLIRIPYNAVPEAPRAESVPWEDYIASRVYDIPRLRGHFAVDRWVPSPYWWLGAPPIPSWYVPASPEPVIDYSDYRLIPFGDGEKMRLEKVV